MILIVDASVTISWIAADEHNKYAAAALAAFETDSAIVPAIWHWEISNTLLVLERKGRLVDAIATYLQLVRLPIDIEVPADGQRERAISELQLARTHNLSAYDAAYLALAKATSHSLATLDAKLASAARKERVYFDN